VGSACLARARIRQALLKHPEQFVQTLTEKLMTYAVGRSLEYSDMRTVRKIVRDDYRFSSVVMGIVTAPAFQSSVLEPNKLEHPAAN
jgi:hypothetical protein